MTGKLDADSNSKSMLDEPTDIYLVLKLVLQPADLRLLAGNPARVLWQLHPAAATIDMHIGVNCAILAQHAATLLPAL